MPLSQEAGRIEQMPDQKSRETDNKPDERPVTDHREE